MLWHRRPVRSAWTIILLMASASAAQNNTVPVFKNGDRVTLIGDSITRGGLFHADIALFYQTRFPGSKIDFVNCGRSGGTAVNAVNRWEWDILPSRPTVATIMFGMNDVGSSPDKPGADVINSTEWDSRTLKGLAAVDELVQKCRQINCSVILMTPTPFDATADLKTPTDKAKAAALAAWSEREKQYALKQGLPIVDFFAPMTAITRQEQAKDPAFTLTGADRTHPGPAGHLVAAYQFLKAQGVSPIVSEIVLDDAKTEPVRQTNCQITELRKQPRGLLFTVREHALPFPLPGGTEAAASWVNFQDELNREMLLVTSLPAGDYDIVIDETPVSRVSAAELAAGVNLALITKTPQYQQALTVQKANAARFKAEANGVRAHAMVRERVLQPKKIDLNDSAAVVNAVKAFRDHDPTVNSYIKGVCDLVIEDTLKHNDPAAEVAQATQQMRQLALPRPHHFAIIKVEHP